MLIKNNQLRQLANNLQSALIIGPLTIISCISYSTLIFSGVLSPFLSFGIGAALISLVLLNPLISWFGAIPEAIVVPQPVICALLAVIATDIANSLNSSGMSNQIFPTVMFLITLSSFLMGIVFLILGYFQWGAFFVLFRILL